MRARITVGIAAALAAVLVIAALVAPTATGDTVAFVGFLAFWSGFAMMSLRRLRWRIAGGVAAGGFVLLMVGTAIIPDDVLAAREAERAAASARQSPLPPALAARAERQRAERDTEQQTRGEVAALVRCPRRVERLAQYTHRWTDGFLEPKFSHSRSTGNRNVVTYLGDRLEFQNGFGAWQPHIYECDLNVVTEQVVAVRARPGRLR